MSQNTLTVDFEFPDYALRGNLGMVPFEGVPIRGVQYPDRSETNDPAL